MKKENIVVVEEIQYGDKYEDDEIAVITSNLAYAERPFDVYVYVDFFMISWYELTIWNITLYVVFTMQVFKPYIFTAISICFCYNYSMFSHTHKEQTRGLYHKVQEEKNSE